MRVYALSRTILTPFVGHYFKNSYGDPEKALDTSKKRPWSSHLGRPKKVAEVARFLAADNSIFMMGSPLYIDGGVTFGKYA